MIAEPELYALTNGLVERIAGAARDAQTGRRPVLAGFTRPLATRLDPAVWFAAAAGRFAERAYFAPPGDRDAVCGLGVAAEVRRGADEPLAELSARLHDLFAGASPDAGLVALGGFAFDPARPAAAEWAGFPSGRLVVPRLLLRTGSTGSTLTVAVRVEPNADVAALALELARDVTRATSLVAPKPSAPGELTFVSDPHDFPAMVASGIAAIRASVYQKIVLARRLTADGSAEYDLAAALRRLRDRERASFVFAFGAGDATFAGATPERLVALDQRRFEIDCLAGTIGRGETPADDERLAAALFSSEKDRREHDVVVQSMRRALTDCCEEIGAAPTPRLRVGRSLQHLFTPVWGRVAAGRTILDLVERLHPTPAVGGEPRAAALAAIRALEPFDRGWYAGPVGWVDAAGDGEFAVAIRSALVRGREARLYAGCGIMADSDPQNEFDETNLKLATMMTALGLDR